MCGNQEMEEGAVAVRTRWGKDLGKIDVDEFLTQFSQEVRERTIVQPDTAEN